MTDILLCAIPKHGVNVPPLAIAYLQGVCKAHGFSTDIRDFNLELWESTIHTDWWEIWKESNETLYKGKKFFKFYDEVYKHHIDKWAKEIAEHPATYVGISCFSYRSLPTLKYLSPLIKKYNPNKKIIVGGSPVYTYHKWIIENNLADYAVSNEGENALLEILYNKAKPGHILKPQIQDLNTLPKPDYTGFDFERYVPRDPGGLRVRESNYKRDAYEAGIMGSRGCVRRCTFCDVETFYPKFRWRSAQSIYDEMLHLLDKGINHIYFFDSLINGNQKELETLCNLIIADGSKFESIKGLGIIKQMPERLYEKLERANFKQIMLSLYTHLTLPTN